MKSLPLSQLISHTADAVQAVRAGRSLNEALARCPSDARPGVQALSFEVLRRLGAAQAVRARLAPKTPSPPVDALLLTALALLWPGAQDGARYEPHTVVDQAVDAAKRRSQSSAPFINAVLRRFLREREALVKAAEADPVAHHNHPRWWIDRLRADWPAQWESVLAANNHHPPMALRVNTRRGSVEAYRERLRQAGIAARPAGAQGLLLGSPVPVQQLPGFADGDVSVQDSAAQLAAPLLIGPGLPPGARVLDACAAPGGKTAHLLELAELDVLALDADPVRLERVHDTLRRLGLAARSVAADARRPDSWWDGQPFDAILLDAPCSASGIVRRHPDVRWLRRDSDIPALARTQGELLDALWPLLKPGGRLLYCTCSVFKAEGQQVIDAFLQRRGAADAALQPTAPGHLLPLPDNSDNGAAPASGASPDGFFYALLAKAP
ncbi:16S rRNA (cytosine(967)-C(5))-methyltransferase RsmB [Piscinibacter sp. HJYY11]|uniref:16S rRNA (cytosine(967)-C(5))-methyltransferase RsmB n=1 Tax=Piscinibacter sp. HJYY11 TaxID=2801333 RepID=UPI00191CE825|nr:16S rRNA (cytosine(967)-C(5))-methyltransferase RsmB [Piscinibacter sp. HJYY11]MBL0729335.1 16S rRNA (cytosine(967)-C(5))-methyltransferase RsmB [Piscinibacter sp. HJYY11]